MLTCTMSSGIAGVNINISCMADALVGAHRVVTLCQWRALMESRMCTLIYIYKDEETDMKG